MFCRSPRHLLTEAEQNEVFQDAWGDVAMPDRHKILLQYAHVVTNVRYVCNNICRWLGMRYVQVLLQT
jgi:hypothetical protein